MLPLPRATCLAFLLASAALGGCIEREPLLHPSATIEGPYRLDSGDRLRVVVFEQPGLTNIYEVNQLGYVSVPLVGDVPARNATTGEIAARIEAKLAASYLRNPDVTVEIAQYRPFFALGEVGTPGQYPYVPGMTAENAVAAAGGYTDRANRRIVRVSRTLNGVLYEGRIAVTEPIRPGDTVYVSEALF